MDTRTDVERLCDAGEYRLAGIVHRAQGGVVRPLATAVSRGPRGDKEAFLVGWDECNRAFERAEHERAYSAPQPYDD